MKDEKQDVKEHHSMGSQEQQAAEVLRSLDNKQLQETVIKALVAVAEKDKELNKQRKIVAELSQRDQKNRARARQLIEDAKVEAEHTREEAERILAAAKRKSDATDKEIAEKLANAAAEADSIVWTQLNEKKHDIAMLEAKRDKTKRVAINLCTNIAKSIDAAIEDVEKQISDYKDRQQEIDEILESIKSEQFTNFDINDFVDEQVEMSSEPASTPAAEEVVEEVTTIDNIENEELQLNASELEALTGYLNDFVAQEEVAVEEISATDEAEEIIDFEPEPVITPEPVVVPEPEPVAVPEPVVAPEPEPVIVPEPEPIIPESESAPKTVGYQPSFEEPMVEETTDDFGADDNVFDDEELDFLTSTLDFEEEDEQEEVFADGKMKSFTSSFMPVAPVAEPADDLMSDFDDLADDFDIDAMLEDDDFDDVVEPEPEPEPAPAPISVPRRSHGRSTGTPSRWLS